MNETANLDRSFACDASDADLKRASRLREATLRRELAFLLQERGALRTERDALRDQVERLAQQLTSQERLVAELQAAQQALPGPRKGVAVRLLELLRRQSPGVPPASAHVTPVALLSPPRSAVASLSPVVACTDTGSSIPRGRILIAADIPPLFDMHSGGLRLQALIQIMGSANWNVAFASLTDRDRLPGALAIPEQRIWYEERLRAAGVRCFAYGHDEIAAFLQEDGRSLDWAFLSFPRVAQELMPLVRSHCRTTRIIFDMVDFHGLRLAREAALRGDPSLAAEAGRQRAAEVACAKAADITLAVTLEEKSALLDLVPDAVVEVVPNVFDVPRHAVPGPEQRSGLLFVGGFWHTPNGDAAIWFVEQVWPIVRREAPDQHLSIVGSNPTDEVLALNASPGVDVLGYVPDLAPLFDRHRLSIAPLRFGAGMKGKVGQSLIHGLPSLPPRLGPRAWVCSTVCTSWSQTRRRPSPLMSCVCCATTSCGGGCPSRGERSSRARSRWTS